MRGLHPAASERDRTNAPMRRAELRYQPGGRDDVGDRIPRANLVKGDVLGRRAVDLGFGFRQFFEDTGRVTDGVSAERRTAQRIADVPPGDMMVMPCMTVIVLRMTVIMMMVAVMVMVVMVIMRVISPVFGMMHLEAAAGQHAVVMGHEFARDVFDQRAAFQRRLQAGIQVRPEIEQGCDEHVACNAADGVEVNFQHGHPPYFPSAVSVSEIPFAAAMTSERAGTKD